MEFTSHDIRNRTKRMRHGMTHAEARLWSWLRNRRFGDHKFRRQHPIGEYIADFYCRELKLIIEVDGAVHGAVRDEYDTRRTLILQTYGIEVLRLRNEIILRDPLTAADQIRFAIDSRPSPGLRPPSPGGRGL